MFDLTDSPSWDHVPNFESAEEYHAFAHYRDMGPSHRTLSGVARDLGVSPGTVAAWARSKLWAERCASYDRFRIAEREARRKAAEAAADSTWAEERAELLAKATRITNIALAQLVERLERRIAGGMADQHTVRMLDVLMKWRNLAEGEATERVDVSGQIDYSGLTDEELRTLDKVLPRNGEKE